MIWSIASLFTRPASPAKKRTPHRNRLRLETLEDRLTPPGRWALRLQDTVTTNAYRLTNWGISFGF